MSQDIGLEVDLKKGGGVNPGPKFRVSEMKCNLIVLALLADCCLSWDQYFDISKDFYFLKGLIRSLKV